MEKTFLVIKEYTTRNFMYVKAENEEEAMKLADVGEGTSDRYTEYEPVENVSVKEAEKIEKINNMEDGRVKKIGYHIIEKEEKGKKTKLKLNKEKAEKASVGSYLRYKDKLYEVYAKTQDEIFVKRSAEKIRIKSDEIIGLFVEFKNDIETRVKNKVVVRMDITNVDQLYARFIDNLQQIIRFENANYTYDELECYLEERQKIDWYEHQSKTKYYINTSMTDNELEEFADQRWIEVKTFSQLWDELSLEAKVIINQIRRGYGEAGERKYFKANIGDKVDYRNDLAYDLTSQIEVTQDVLYEIDKYSDIIKTFECDIKNNTIEIWEAKDEVCA